MNITVYLGANAGNDPALRDAVRALGRWIGESGNALVYGGSKNGLMGALAESVLAAGGRATGVEPQIFVDQGFLYDELTELIVTRDFPERKAKMLELGDAFIAFPGGTGTLEEITEVMSRVALGQLGAPCILYNLNGYYDGLRTQLAHMIELGLSSEARQRGIYFADDLEQIRQLLDPTGPRTSQAGGAFCIFMRYAFLCVSSFTMAKPRNSTMPTICTGASGSPSSSTDTSTDTMGSM